MPERLAYDEAMRFPQTRLQIQDPEIRQGQVEMITISTKIGQITQPWGVEGGFAVVYKFRTNSGKFRALRCFRRDMDPDMQFRYERIGPYFQVHASQITAGFKYHEQGILIKEPTQPQGKVYPVIEMDWIEGTTLLEKVDELCQQRDRARLRDLGQQWLTLLKIMQQAKIAHGDLAGLNIMVRPNGSLALIDYDGVYIPNFTPHNLRQLLVGQQDYQHPQMNKRPFNEHTDAFSALVIYTVLLVLAWKPELWERYINRGSDKKLIDTNLLFKQQDFQEPHKSSVFQELEQCPDSAIRAFIQTLKRASLQPVDQLRFPFHMIDPDYEKKLALEQLARVLPSNDDAQIAAVWNVILEYYAPAQAYRARVQLAQQRVSALQQWRVALQSRQIAQIVTNYHPLLDHCSAVIPEERRLLDVARKFAQAAQRNDEDALLKLHEMIQRDSLPLTLTSQERLQVEYILESRRNLQSFMKAVSSRLLNSIVVAYQKLSPHQVNYLNSSERRYAILANAFLQAYQRDSDAAIVAAYTDLLHEKAPINLEPAQQIRVEQACKREAAREVLEQAMLSGNLRATANAYDPLLEESTELTQQEIREIQAIHQFIIAYDANDDQQLLAAYQNLQIQQINARFTLASEENAHLHVAQQRQQARHNFEEALSTGEPYHLVASYNPLLANCLSSDVQAVLALAQEFVARDSNDELFLTAYRQIQSSPYQNFFQIREEDQLRLAAIERDEQQLNHFTWTLEQHDASKIVNAYHHLPIVLRNRLDYQQQELIARADQALAMYVQVQQALAEKNTRALCQIYQPSLAQDFPRLFSPGEEDEINNVLKNPQITERLRELDYRQVLKLAEDISHSGGLKGQRARVRQAVRQFLRQTRVSEVSACIEEQGWRKENLLWIQWSWPQDKLIEDACIFWDADHWPVVPGSLTITKADRSTAFQGNYLIVNRLDQEDCSRVEIDINRQKNIYTKVCFAVYDRWDDEAVIETWYFSPVVELVVQVCQKSTKQGW